MVEYFQHARLPHLIFGEGSIARLVELAATFGKQALILTGRQSFILKSSWPTLQRELTAKGLLFSQEVIAEEPSPSLVDEIVSRNQAKSVEVVIAIGGGSVIDAGKAVSAMLCHPYPTKSYLEGVGDRRPTAAKIPFIAVPTTAGTGSEATKNAVLSEVGPEGFKKSLRHDAYVPDIALLDPDLATTASPTVTAAAGMDAFTQLLEAYLSTKASSFTDALAWEGLTHIQLGFLSVVENGQDIAARTHMAYAAYLSGVCLANAGLGLVHGYASSVGGKISIPHGILCGSLMGVVNHMTLDKLLEEDPSSKALQKYAKVGSLFLGERPYENAGYAKGLTDLIQEWIEKVNLPRLSGYGLGKKMIPALAAATGMKNHPIEFSQEEKEEMLRKRL